MRRLLGIAGLTALAVATHFSVRGMIVRADRPIVAQADGPSGEIRPRIDASPIPGRSIEVPRDVALRLLQQPAIAQGHSVTGSRSVRLFDVVAKNGIVTFAGRADLYHRDEPGFYVWRVRVLDERDKDIRFEWYDTNESFLVAPGTVASPLVWDALPLDLDRGDYIFELTVENLGEEQDLSKFTTARQRFSVK